ncbi:hypothetical protein SRABI106_04853 [Rahnella aquatilis]|nr:hypothetical protein SRABI106_04853 [Rahnella aquatilis]
MVADQRRQFIKQVIVHPVMRCPWRLRGIQVKTGALTEIVTVVVGDTFTARAGIRHHQNHTEFCRDALRPGFDREVFIITGQARQPVQHRRRRVVLRRRQINAERHAAIQALRGMAVALLPAAKHPVFFE